MVTSSFFEIKRKMLDRPPRDTGELLHVCNIFQALMTGHDFKLR